MKKSHCFIIILAAASLSLGQAKPAGVMPMHQDSIQTAGKSYDRDANMMELRERQHAVEEKGEGYGIHQRGMDEMRNEFYRPWGMHPAMTPMRHMMMACFMFGMLICSFIVLLNILFTILVTMDMTRNNRFNGLWIPILLLAGIPGSAIYALFRIGDINREKAAKA